MKDEKKVARKIPDIDQGLSNEEVEERKQQGLNNKTEILVGKTYLEIIFTDVFSYFNILLFAVAGLLIAAKYWQGLSFLIVLIPNIAISLYEDLKARRLMSKLRVLTEAKATVIRNGQKEIVPTQDILLDDIVCLQAESQICVDGKLLSGSLLVNESALTGESKNIHKSVGDQLLSGSYVVSGAGVMHAEKVGEDSYIETIQTKAKKFRRSPSAILKTLTYMFRVIGSIVLCMAAATFVVYAVKGGFKDYESFQVSIRSIAGSMVAMIPAGLFLLTSVALAVSVLKLSKKGARVQDFYSVEMLARANVLCVDKTGTITNGEMDVTDVIPVGDVRYSREEISQIMSNLLLATKDTNLTAKSLQKAFNYESTKGVVTALPFTSESKYSAATFTGNETYVLGALEFLNIANAPAVNKRCEEYTTRGLRVMVLAKAERPINDHKVEGILHPVALIVLQDHIREDAVETFAWFKANGVAIKVISGDDPRTVSHIALEAGIEDADKYISLVGLTNEEVIDAVDKYQVFGRVSPEQKEIIIMTLKKSGKTVAMTGDGVNDILALKRADCSIAMNSGSEAAKNVSHVVLVNSDFGALPSVVGEGRRVINNLQRTGSLFLTKTTFAFITSLVFLITMATIGVAYPFAPTHFQLWSLVNIGLAAFFLSLEPSQDPTEGSFIKNVIRKAIPGSIAVLVPVGVIFLLHILQTKNIFYSGTYEYESAVTMCVIAFTIVGLVVLLKVCLPLNKYRGLVFGGAVFIEAALMVAAAIISYKVGVTESMFAINFPSLTLVNWFVTGIIIVLTASIYLIVSYIVEVFRGEHQNDKN